MTEVWDRYREWYEWDFDRRRERKLDLLEYKDKLAEFEYREKLRLNFLITLITRGYTSIYFGENQLSPGLIGLSPLATAHPGSFQPTTVRSSTRFYPSFNLAMARSPGFGSTPGN